MSAGFNIREQAVVDSRLTLDAGVVRKEPLKFTAAATLGDLTEDWTFFTPALMYIFLNLKDRDPISGFYEECGAEVPQFTVKFRRPVLRGLTVGKDTDWNHVLYAISNDWWPKFIGYLGTLTLVDRQLDYVARVRTAELSVVDPLWADRLSVVPEDKTKQLRVNITALCLDTNRGCLFIREGRDLEPALFQYSAQVLPDTKQLSEAILTHSVNPYAAIADEDNPWLQQFLPKGDLK